MTTEPQQPSLTGERIRAILARIEDPTTSPLERIRSAAEVAQASEELIAECVADARQVPGKGRRAAIRAGKLVAVPKAASDHSAALYGWDVIGWVLGVTKQRAHQRYAPPRTGKTPGPAPKRYAAVQRKDGERAGEWYVLDRKTDRCMAEESTEYAARAWARKLNEVTPPEE